MVRNCVRCLRDFEGKSKASVCEACAVPKRNTSKAGQGRHARVLGERGKPLSRREKQLVAYLMDGGLANKEIAARLHLSEGTVKEYFHTIFRKLGVTTRYELMLWCVQSGCWSPKPQPTSLSGDDDQVYAVPV